MPPTGYSWSDHIDDLAVAILNLIFAKHRDSKETPVRPVSRIEKSNTHPNTDGEVELTDQDDQPIGKLEVQVKALNPKYLSKPKLCNIPAGFLAYCRKSVIPVILIGVDRTNNKAYWLHMTKSEVGKRQAALNVKEDGKSHYSEYEVKLPSENLIDKDNYSYLDKWQLIYMAVAAKVLESDTTRRAEEKLLDRASTEPRLPMKDFMQMQVFAKELNDLLEMRFPVAKSTLIGDSPRVGVAYSMYSDWAVGFLPFGTSPDLDRPEICEMSPSLATELGEKGMSFAFHTGPNPIRSKPQECAREFVASEIGDILKNRRLVHFGDPFLAIELVTYFMDIYGQRFGLGPKASHLITDIEDMLKMCRAPSIPPKPKIDPKHYQIEANRLREIAARDQKNSIGRKLEIRERLELMPSLPYGPSPHWLPFRLFLEAYAFLKEEGIMEVRDPYRKNRFNTAMRMKGRETANLLDLFSDDDFKHDARVFLKNLPRVFEHLVERNFPDISHDLSLFRNREVIVPYEFLPREDRGRMVPCINVAFAASQQKRPFTIHLVNTKECPEVQHLLDFRRRQGSEFSGALFDVHWHSATALDSLLERPSVLRSAYIHLASRLKSYFHKELGLTPAETDAIRDY